MPQKKPTPLQALLAGATNRMPLPEPLSPLDNDDKLAARETYNRFEDAFMGQLQKFRLAVPEAVWEQHVKDADAEIAIANRKQYIRLVEQSKIRRVDTSGHPLLSYAQARSAFDNILREKTGMEDFWQPSDAYRAIGDKQINIAQAVWQGNDTDALAEELAKLLYNQEAYDKVAATPEDASKAAMKVVDAAQKAKQEALGLTKPRGR